MPARTYPHAPLEFYGVSVFSNQDPPSSEDCPFLKEAGIQRRCDKIRKGRDEHGNTITIGTCVAEQTGYPVILSPWRMYQGLHIFRDAAQNLQTTNWIVVPEVTTPFGAADYVILGLDANGQPTEDYVGLEIQTMDTTGSLWQAKIDWYQRRKLHAPYKYGMNWAHIAKLMLVQALNKAPFFTTLGKRYIWAIQDALLDYLEKTYGLAGFTEEQSSTTLFSFYSYSLRDDGDRFTLVPARKVSGDLAALAKLLERGDVEYDLTGQVKNSYARSKRVIRMPAVPEALIAPARIEASQESASQ